MDDYLRPTGTIELVEAITGKSRISELSKVRNITLGDLVHAQRGGANSAFQSFKVIKHRLTLYRTTV